MLVARPHSSSTLSSDKKTLPSPTHKLLATFLPLRPFPHFQVFLFVPIMVDLITKDFNTARHFAEHLVSTMSDDILEFWLDVEFFKRLDDGNKIKDTATYIHTTYIVPNAKKEIILDPLLKHSIMRSVLLASCDSEMFNAAQYAIGRSLNSRGNVDINTRGNYFLMLYSSFK